MTFTINTVAHKNCSRAALSGIGGMLSFDISLEDALRSGRCYWTTFWFMLLSHSYCQAVSGMIWLPPKCVPWLAFIINNEQVYKPATCKFKAAVNVHKQISSRCRESNYSALLLFVDILNSFNHVCVVWRLDQITRRVKRKCQVKSKPVCADRPLWP